MSSAVDATDAFLASIRGCGLLKSTQIQELENWTRGTRPDVQAVARELNRRAWLTAFQIREIYKGNGRDLTLGRRLYLLDAPRATVVRSARIGIAYAGIWAHKPWRFQERSNRYVSQPAAPRYP